MVEHFVQLKFDMADFPKIVMNDCIGLTGGIATGKSTVVDMLKDLGCRIIDTDLIARQVVEPGQPALKEISDHFGCEVLNDAGTLNRERLRSIIIEDPKKRELLNTITHPRIGLEVLRQVNEFRAGGSNMPIIVDVPLLYEAGWQAIFPMVILVYVPEEVQVERLMKRDKLSREEAIKTLTFQMSIEEKKMRTSFIIDNSGTIEETKQKVKVLFEKLLKKQINFEKE